MCDYATARSLCESARSVKNMAGHYDLNRFFIEDIPSIHNQAQRNLYSNDINVLEFFVRRLDDHIFVIQSVLRQCLYMETDAH